MALSCGILPHPHRLKCANTVAEYVKIVKIFLKLFCVSHMCYREFFLTDMATALNKTPQRTG
jgi:hypothetical protein